MWLIKQHNCPTTSAEMSSAQTHQRVESTQARAMDLGYFKQKQEQQN